MPNSEYPQAREPFGRGQLNVLTRVLAAYGEDLARAERAPAEQAAATVLDALHTAILLEETADLARLVKPWLDARLVGATQARPLDEADREQAITELRAQQEA